MDKLYDLKDRLCGELEMLSGKGEYNTGDLEKIYYLASAVKNLDKVIESNEENGGSYRGGSYDGGSYARGRGRNARRDSMGRYSRDGGYSNERGYSRDSEDMASRLEGMMQDAPNDQVRQDIRKLVDKVRSM